MARRTLIVLFSILPSLTGCGSNNSGGDDAGSRGAGGAGAPGGSGGAGGTGTGGSGGAGTGGSGGTGTDGSGGTGTGGSRGATGRLDGGDASGTAAEAGTDGGPRDTAADSGAGTGSAMGSAALTGMFGSDPIRPIQAAYWNGMPNDVNEAGGGPFVYLFSGPVTCADLSRAPAWIGTLPAGVQVLEMLIGATTPGMPVMTVQSYPKGMLGAAEVNFAVAPVP